jgi:endonuclease/exonuclease/phosphatase family metal-dependent hydrolase
MSKSYYILLTALVCTLLGCQVAVQEKSLSSSNELVINAMTFNIRNGLAQDGENHWNKRTGLVVDTIINESADVIGIQEAFRFQLDELNIALPIYAEVGEGRQGGVNDEYSAILYRTDRFMLDKNAFGTFWLSDTPAVPSTHWGNNHQRICTWARLIDKATGQAFYIYNTHLDHRSQLSREKSVRLIINIIQTRSHQDPFLLMGDFNAGEDNPAIEYLLGKTNSTDSSTPPIPMLDSYRILHPDTELVGTFNGFKGQLDGEKIDYIFVEPDVNVIYANIVKTNINGRYASDHFPVTARIQFSPPKLSR